MLNNKSGSSKERFTRFAALLAGSSALCGGLPSCGKSPVKKLDNKLAPTSSANLNASAASGDADAGRSATAPPARNPTDFSEMFQNELSARPGGTIKVEDALAAFKKDGIELNTVRQHLARPYHARYCVGGMSGTDVAISLCEYIDPATANVGVETSRKLTIAYREIKLNQATSLTVRELEKTPAADAMQARLFESFAKLK